MDNVTVLYRYQMHSFEEVFTPKVYVKEYKIISKTDCGWWIHKHGSYGPKKFVLEGQGKRFAYPTKEMALEGFIYRRRRYQRILETLVKGNRKVIKVALQLQKGG